MKLKGIIGIIIIILGFLILLTGISIIPQSVISFGPISITDVPPINATRIFVGIVLIIIGGLFIGVDNIKKLFK